MTNVTEPRAKAASMKDCAAPWLLLLFSLPAKQASGRVEIWRKLKRYGALFFQSSGYLLPNTPLNQERFEWLASEIRKYKGTAAVVQVSAIDDLSSAELQRMFIDARTKDYEALLRDIKRSKPNATTARFRKRLQDIVDVDFFGSPMRARVETAIAVHGPKTAKQHGARQKKNEFRARTWVTRPRPGIDRVSSAWLITKYIDPAAKFAFTNNVRAFPNAVPFDMFNVGGFTHDGDKCTFETLCSAFNITDRKVQVLAQIVHDADLDDEKFGRPEGAGLDRILRGWARQGTADGELLRRGIDLIEGLYQSTPE